MASPAEYKCYICCTVFPKPSNGKCPECESECWDDVDTVENEQFGEEAEDEED